MVHNSRIGRPCPLLVALHMLLNDTGWAILHSRTRAHAHTLAHMHTCPHNFFYLDIHTRKHITRAYAHAFTGIIFQKPNSP